MISICIMLHANGMICSGAKQEIRSIRKNAGKELETSLLQITPQGNNNLNFQIRFIW